MYNWTGTVIAWLWLAFIAVWFISAFNVKRTAERYPTLRFRYVLIIAVGLALIGFPHKFFVNSLWTAPTWLGIFADLVVLIGLAIAVWARLTLGRN